MPESSSSSGFPESLSSSSSPVPPVPPGGTAEAGGVGRQNKAILRELLKCEQIFLGAQRSEYAAALAAREITAADMTAQIIQVEHARALASGAGKVAKAKSTVDETKARTAFLAFYDEFQAAAKQKFARTDRLHLRLYHVGENHLVSRAILEQYGEDVMDHAEADNLPGITPAKITAARAALAAYVRANVDQTAATSAAGSQQVSLKAMVKGLTDWRVKVQLAAEAQWPHTDPANVPIRKVFLLSPDRKYTA